MERLIPIRGKIRHYRWGGQQFISDLTGMPNPDGKPCAEYWLGSHPSDPAEIVGGRFKGHSLLDVQRVCPEAGLHFLLKVLDVREMLSIQVHPVKAQAQEGYAREEALGIPLMAPERNYKDTEEKAELMVALSEFWLLHGIKNEEAIRATLEREVFLKPLREVFETGGIAAAFALALDAQDERVRHMQEAVRLRCWEYQGEFCKDRIEFWIQRWVRDNPDTLGGILTLYLMNLVKLEPGEGIYQPPGLLHAYLEGQNIELMGNSDNVLRAGLTSKYIDTAELLKVCTLESSQPADFRIREDPLSDDEVVFSTPFEDFELSRLSLAASDMVDWMAQAVQVLFCLEGEVRLQVAEQILDLRMGDAVLVLPGAQVHASASVSSVVYKAANKY